MSDEELRVTPGYALDQLRRALETAGRDESEEVRARAHARVEKWVGVIEGMVLGRLTVGSRTYTSEVRSNGSYVCQNDLRLHFGLGRETSATAVVRWPDGHTTEHPNLAADRIHDIEE